VEEVNFSHNPNFGPEGAWEVGYTILDDPRYGLQSLILDECGLGDKGAENLGEKLCYNEKLRFLDISNNNIKAQGAIDFGRWVAPNGKLAVLFMHWNPIGFKGGEAIAKILQTNNAI